MENCPWNFLHDKQKHIVSLVGGGGKTTIMYELGTYLLYQGCKVVATTTTHIWQPAQGYCATWAQVEQLWQERSYVPTIGAVETGTGKLVQPAPELLAQALRCADYVLVEADGSKHLTCKVPRDDEPVLLPECDIVIAVAGMDALGRALDEVCFRWQLGGNIFAGSCNMLMDEFKMSALIANERGGRKDVGSRAFYVALNKCELAAPEKLERLRALLIEQGIGKENIWLRYGSRI